MKKGTKIVLGIIGPGIAYSNRNRLGISTYNGLAAETEVEAKAGISAPSRSRATLFESC